MKICPSCKTKMSDSYNDCSVCGCDLSGAYVVDSATYNSNVVYNRKRSKIIKINIVIATIVVLAASCVAFYYISNKSAEQCYKEAYSSLFDIDLTHISSNTESLIEKAVKKSASPFVDEETRKKIEDLDIIATEYEMLGEIENKLSSGNISEDGITELESKFGNIKTNEVMRSERYSNVKPYIKSIVFKYKNKSWADNALKEIKNKYADNIASWSRNNRVIYYTGSVYLSNQYGDNVEVILEDFNGDTHTLELVYNYGNDSWNDYLLEIVNILKNNQSCVMAVAAAEGYGIDQVFACSYTAQ